MDNPNAPAEGAESQELSPEVSDYFGEILDNSDESKDENVNSDEKEETPEENTSETEDNKTTDKDDTDEEKDKSEADTEEIPKEEVEEEEESEDDKDKSNTPKVYKIGGQEFKTPEEAIERATSVHGDNSRLVGEVKKLTEGVSNFQQQLDDKDSKIKELQEANEKWQKFNDGDIDEKPDEVKPPEVDIKKLVKETITQEREEQTIAEKAEQFKTEAEELKEILGIEKHVPVMHKILDNYFGGDSSKISPKELYNMSIGFFKNESPSIDDAVEDLKKKESAKDAAKKVVGGNAKKSGSIKKEELSPEIADYFNHNV